MPETIQTEKPIRNAKFERPFDLTVPKGFVTYVNAFPAGTGAYLSIGVERGEPGTPCAENAALLAFMQANHVRALEIAVAAPVETRGDRTYLKIGDKLVGPGARFSGVLQVIEQSHLLAKNQQTGENEIKRDENGVAQLSYGCVAKAVKITPAAGSLPTSDLAAFTIE